MIRYCLFLIFSIALTAFGQNSDPRKMPMPNIDSASTDEEVNIWDKGLFSEIPQDTKAPIITVKNYKEVLARYESEEFTYSENIKDRISFVDRLIARLRNWLSDLMPQSNYEFKETFYYILGGIAVIILVYIVYKLIYSKNAFFRKDKNEGEDTESDELTYVEKNLMNTNLQPYLKDAVTNQDFSLAIRYLQLLNIQKLAEAELIKWKYSKTNSDFANEIDNNLLKKDFQQCTRIFEYVWFGDFQLNQPDFERYQQDFKQFQSKIS